MKIFVTGGTGWVGSAVLQELVAHGHTVSALVRSEAKAGTLASGSVRPVFGTLEACDEWLHELSQVDAVIHTAFDHDWSRFSENSEVERRVLAAMGHALRGSDKRLLVTSGVALIAPGRVATERDAAPAAAAGFPRAPEATLEALNGMGVRAAVIRLAPSVHGLGDHGFVPRLAAIAREKGVSAYIGDGLNRWPAVHRLDAARLYRLALEQPLHGPFHAVAETGVSLKAIATVIGQQLGVPTRSITSEEAAGHFGWFAPFVGLDAPASSDHTRAALGWVPEQPGLLADLAVAAYLQPDG
ncbi:SDR family oxidoreductase [Frateuria aurantia]